MASTSRYDSSAYKQYFPLFKSRVARTTTTRKNSLGVVDCETHHWTLSAMRMFRMLWKRTPGVRTVWRHWTEARRSRETNKQILQKTSQIERFSATQFGNSVTDTFASFSGNDIETCGVSLDASVNNVLFHVLRVISRAPTLRSTNGYRGRKDGLTVRAYQNACSTLKPSFVTSRAF